MNAYFFRLVENDLNSTVALGLSNNKIFAYPYALINSDNKLLTACLDETNAETLLSNSRYGGCSMIKLADAPTYLLNCAKERQFDSLSEVAEFVKGGYKDTAEYKISVLENTVGLTFDVENSTLEEYQDYRQEENKKALAAYLKANPLKWTDGEYYGVSQDDQLEMQSDLAAYNLKQQAGDTSWKLEWHNVKKSCREFTLEEFTQLMVAIVNYVYPLRRLQETYKEAIYSCSSKSELSKLVFSYDDESDDSQEPVVEVVDDAETVTE